jgi:hypothetical protein
MERPTIIITKDTPIPPRGRPFAPGTSGNPNGRPKGSRNKATLAWETLLEGDCEAILGKLIEKAKEGDSAALRLYVDRLLPVRRDRTVVFDLPEIKNAADAEKATSSIVAACAAGDLTPDEAEKVMGLVTAHTRMIQMSELEARLEAVEKAQKL